MSTTTLATVPAFFALSLLYRDASNNKNFNTAHIINDANMSEKDFVAFIEAHIGNENVMAEQWGLPNPAPASYEWEDAGELDHCFIGIRRIEAVDKIGAGNDGTVLLSALRTAVEQGGTAQYHRDRDLHLRASAQQAVDTTVKTLRDTESPSDEVVRAAKNLLLNQGYRLIAPEQAQPAMAIFQAPHDLDLGLVMRVAYGAMAESSIRPHIIEQLGRATVDKQVAALSRYLGG